jgi:flagellar biosynthesis/type III secretory pathway chaperone
MDSSNDNIQRLNKLLTLLSEKATLLLSVISEESTALSSATPEKLEPILLEKNEITSSLNKLEQHRVTLLQQMGFKSNEMESCLQQTNQPKLNKKWQQFLDIITECQKKNEENGAIITLQNKQNQQLINILQGFSGKNQTYNKSGNTNQKKSGRIIGSA